jgi:hypothetical protein
MKLHWVVYLAVIALDVVGAAALRAEDNGAVVVSSRLQSLTDEEVNDRLRFAEEKLDYRRDYANYWWKGWTGFYIAGIGERGYKASHTDSAGKRADFLASVVKSGLGIFDKMRDPLRARFGADPVREMPSATREDRLRQLAVAEEALRKDAQQADRRYSILRHVGNLVVNAGAAVIVTQAFDTSDKRGWTSAGVGFAVGEVMIWSQPWWPRQHLDEYESRFGAQRVSWHIVPTIGGAAIQATF